MNSLSSYTLNTISLKDMKTLCSILSSSLNKKTIITLSGNLGSGKTTFTKLLFSHMGIKKETVTSPTFTLCQMYTTKNNLVLWHFDLYRLKSPEEVYEIGFEEALSNGIIVIEWPERLKTYLPKNHLAIHLDFDLNNEKTRTITFTSHGNWIDDHNKFFQKLRTFKP